MTNRSSEALRRVGLFSLALVAGIYCYYLFAPMYARFVLTFSTWFLAPFVEAPAFVSFSDAKGIIVSSPALVGVMAFRYDLFSICLNVIFAPALVVMTRGWKNWGWVKVIAAVFIMLLLHAGEVVVTLLRFLMEKGNPLMPEASSMAASFVRWLYHFADTMGYTLFPFLAWMIVCAGDLARWAGSRAAAKQAVPAHQATIGPKASNCSAIEPDA